MVYPKLQSDNTFKIEMALVLPFHIPGKAWLIGWATYFDVRSALGDSVAITPEDSRSIRLATQAANWYLMNARPDLPVPWQDEKTGPFDGAFNSAFQNRLSSDVHWLNPQISWGVTQLALRWHKRYGTDTASFGEFGGSVPAIDKDIEQVLNVNRAFRPVVA